MNWGSRTETGHVRRRNEDALLVEPDARVFAVADGLGGHPAGDLASATAVSRLRAVLVAGKTAVGAGDTEAAAPPDEGVPEPGHRLVSALQAAHEAVLDRAGSDRALWGMGTTVVLAEIAGDEACVAHVGDSRCYLLHDGRLRQLTRDHGFGGYLTQALGLEGGIEPDVATVRCGPGDVLLLCTDGLTNMVSDADIARLLARASDAQEACDALTAAALDAGGVDNVTTVVVTF